MMFRNSRPIARSGTRMSLPVLVLAALFLATSARLTDDRVFPVHAQNAQTANDAHSTPGATTSGWRISVVHGEAMEPTLYNGDIVLGSALGHDHYLPSRGDVVIFIYPNLRTLLYIKRVIGLPGDRVRIHNHHVYVNGRQLDESYVAAEPNYDQDCSYCDLRVPPNDLYVLGDNRNDSSDSHMWGVLPIVNVLGRVILCFWPASHFGFLAEPNYPGVK
jgi:signal peptidase I